MLITAAAAIVSFYAESHRLDRLIKTDAWPTKTTLSNANSFLSWLGHTNKVPRHSAASASEKSHGFEIKITHYKLRRREKFHVLRAAINLLIFDEFPKAPGHKIDPVPRTNTPNRRQTCLHLVASRCAPNKKKKKK